MASDSWGAGLLILGLLTGYGPLGHHLQGGVEHACPWAPDINYKKFYVDGLGFHVDWEHQFEPGFPVFTQLTRDGLSWFLTEHTGDCQVGGAAYFVVDDVDALYHEISARGIRPAEPPEDTPWQTREMNVIDPDENRLRFANPGAR